jgi:Zn-dependent M28 family amino/carboxypeptidase
MKHTLPIILLLVLLLNGCGSAPVSTPQVAAGTSAGTSAVASLVPLGTPSARYGNIARPLMSDFTAIGARPAGTEGETKAAQYIAEVFKAIGYAPENQPFTATAGDQSITSANVVAVKNGTSSQEIIVGAHYDSTNAGPGSDDNASGVAVMLETAKLVQGMQTPYTIRFIAFGAEESGLLGSYAYLNQMSQDEFQNVIVMIDLDSLVAGDIAYAYSDEDTQSVVRDWALEWALGNGLDLQTIRNVTLNYPDKGIGSSDYAPFQAAGIPYVYFNSTNWNLGEKNGLTQVDTKYGDNGVIRHTKYDTQDYLNASFPGRMDQRLDLFISVLYNLLTQYEAPIQ